MAIGYTENIPEVAYEYIPHEGTVQGQALRIFSGTS